MAPTQVKKSVYTTDIGDGRYSEDWQRWAVSGWGVFVGWFNSAEQAEEHRQAIMLDATLRGFAE